MSGPLRRVLVANRGEIALRVVRACRDLGIASVAVHATEEADAPFVTAADRAVDLGGPAPADTYLAVEKLLAAAGETGADAVHPGYGFLAEDAGFAQAVLDAGLVWIGPPPSVIAALGDKASARALAREAGVPLTPGTLQPVDADGAVAFAREHGLPVVIKAVHGGGGRGMRVAGRVEEIPELFAAATAEASSAFGRGECFVERYLERARHLEAQVLADTHGTVVVVGDRDCSLQRRHQKLVEEAPAPFLPDGVRARLHESATALCRRAGYVGAGTVEYLLAPDGTLSFLEVNTRLQVEHTVTEETTDVDLVVEQLRIAAGEPLSVTAGPPRRHAIEFRVNAEDPARDFRPGTGTLRRFEMPSGPGVRVDTGVRAGADVSGRFDSMLAKIVVVGADRAQALARARRALDECVVDGVPTVLPSLREVLDDPAFAGPDALGVHTRWITDDRPPAAASEEHVEPGRVAVRIGRKWVEVTVPGLAVAEDRRLVEARERGREQRAGAVAEAPDAVVAPMQGTVVGVAVADGDAVAAGDVVVVVEAMKMANALRAPTDGTVSGLAVAVGDGVGEGAVLCRVVAGASP